MGFDTSTVFDKMSKLNVTGVTFDIWWSKVEINPNEYDFSFYKDLLKLALKYKLKV